MAKLLTEESSLISIADAIRAKTGKAESIAYPEGFVSEIGGISGGGLEIYTGTVVTNNMSRITIPIDIRGKMACVHAYPVSKSVANVNHPYMSCAYIWQDNVPAVHMNGVEASINAVGISFCAYNNKVQNTPLTLKDGHSSTSGGGFYADETGFAYGCQSYGVFANGTEVFYTVWVFDPPNI